MNSANTIYAGALNATLGLTGASLRVSGDATVIGDVLYGLGGTSLSSLTTTVNGKANLASPSFSGTLTSVGQIVGQLPVSISFYGTPTCYSTGGVLQTTGFTTTGQTFNLLFPTNTNQNWTPTYTSTYRLVVPYTGLYSLQFTFSSATTCTVFQFITKHF